MTNKWTAMAKGLASKAVTFAEQHKPSDAQLETAKAWTHKAASDTASSAMRLGKESLKSEFVKDVAKGAGVGAVIAVPVPIVGPIIGAIVGGGMGAYHNMTRPTSHVTYQNAAQPAQVAPSEPAKDMYSELLKLDDLLKKGILTEQEFDVQKAKVLSGI